MRVTVLSVPLVGDEVDAGELDEFCQRNEVVACREYLLAGDAAPRLCLVLEYRPRDDEAPRRSRGRARGERGQDRRPAGPRRELAPEDRIVFDMLREWRSMRAASDGVPPYIVMTDRQLADVARKRPAAQAAFGEIPGIGQAKIGRYFADVQEILAASGQAKTAEVDAGARESGAGHD